MDNNNFEYEYVDSSTRKNSCESIFELLDDDSQHSNESSSKRATIVKWNDCTGNIVVPDQIDEQTIVFGIFTTAKLFLHLAQKFFHL